MKNLESFMRNVANHCEFSGVAGRNAEMQNGTGKADYEAQRNRGK